jgi:DNA polymerase-3 subunit gamma/tau
MSYLVIARRFRPQTFGSIVGQEHISRALANAIIRDRLAHALLFTGPRGVGKTTTARVLARALNCTGRELKELKGLSDAEARERIEPCGECPNCLEIAKGNSLTCREIDGASNNSVDNVRELIESLRTLPPPGARYKIYLIDEVHMLSTAAFNALLKSLEEPPPNTIFIFATTDPQKIPETVISRCQQFDFRRLPREVVIENLKRIAISEQVGVEDAVFDLIARKAQGGMRDAQSLLDRLFAFSEEQISLAFAQEVFGVADGRALAALAGGVLEGEPARALQVLEQIFERSLDVRGFVNDFIGFFRGLYLLSLKGSASQLELDVDAKAEALKLVANRESFDLQRLYNMAQETGDRALVSSYPKFAIEAGVAKMATLPSLRPISEVLAALDRAPGTVSKKAESEPATVKLNVGASTFNPQWVDLVNQVHAGSSPMLAQFLRRVTARRFSNGKLEIEGSAFDLSQLKEAGNLEALKKALGSYLQGERWDISFHEVATPVALNSLAAQDEDSRRLRREKVSRDVHEDPLVKMALEAFDGARIERVNPLKD